VPEFQRERYGDINNQELQFFPSSSQSLNKKRCITGQTDHNLSS
jgi:hypothetical protein